MPASASAQAAPGPPPPVDWALGVRAGLGVDPDQFIFGVQLESPGLGRSGSLMFRPSATIGIGDDITLVSGNLDMVYRAHIPASNWMLYFGGGPAVIYTKFDEGDGELGGGANLVVGAAHTRGIFVEVRNGVFPNHNLTIAGGFMLRR
jgi:hypothetical protein